MKKSLPKSAVKESIDNLPAGLCFSLPSGMPLLINRVMYNLSLAIDGQSLQNAEGFWRTLTEGEIKNGAEAVSRGAQPVIRLPDGSFRTFSRSELTVEGRKVIQIIAADTTDLHNMAEQLRENNEALRQLGARLRSYNEQLGELTKREELLSAKMRIHDDVGRTLVRTRYALAQTNPEEQLDSLLDAWQSVADMLRCVIEPKQESSPLDYLRETAGAVGVRLVTNGAFPSARRTAELLTAAASEALTNAVRHGGATELTMEISETPLMIIARFTNNGAQPDGPVSEGGGIGGLRSKLERIGGSISTDISPVFCLTVCIPKQGGA
jgi:hypothetical protein